MNAFPQTIHFIGSNTPRRMELSIDNLAVEGEIPAEIDGAFFRAVPDNAHAPMFEDDVALNADGMIAASTSRTARSISTSSTSRPSATSPRRRPAARCSAATATRSPTIRASRASTARVANTTPVWHAGRLFMTKEDGRAYEINPHTLATVGKWDYYGALKSETFTAHPRVDPVTGELFFFGYEAGGLCSRDIAYGIADADGNLVSEQWFEQPYCSTIHDFVITEKYAIWPIFPTTGRSRPAQGRRRALGAPAGRSKAGSAIMPRYGKVEEMKWIKGPVGRLGVPRGQRLRRRRSGPHRPVPDRHQRLPVHARGRRHPPRPADDLQGALTRWTIDMSEGRAADRGAPARPSGRPAAPRRRRPGPALQPHLVSQHEPAGRTADAGRPGGRELQRADAARARQRPASTDGRAAGRGDQRAGACRRRASRATAAGC